MFETLTHLFPPFPATCVYIKSACHFCRHLFSLIKALDWVETSENLFSGLASVVTQSNQHTISHHYVRMYTSIVIWINGYKNKEHAV